MSQTNWHVLSRRSFLASTVALAACGPTGSEKKESAPVASTAKGKVGLELYSVREEFKKDPLATIRAVAKMGYPGVEFFGSYVEWTDDQAKEIKNLLDELKVEAFSTHTGSAIFADPAKFERAIALNKTLGSNLIVMSSAGKVEGLAGWKTVADNLNKAAEKLKAEGMKVGFHNHKTEFDAIDGIKPIEVLADNTDKSVVLQLDIGTCVHSGSDPVAWINKNPGRITSMHLKDWSSDPAIGYKAVFGEGSAPWKEIFAAAEKNGIEHYLIEQEGSQYSELETAERCLANYKKLQS